MLARGALSHCLGTEVMILQDAANNKTRGWFGYDLQSAGI